MGHLVTVGTSIYAFLKAFATEVGTEAGKDAYAAVKRSTRALWESRRGAGSGSGSVVLRDSDGGHLILSSELPEEALDALADVDWESARGGYLVWDSSKGEWHDAMKRVSR